MDRREYLKIFAISSLSPSLLLKEYNQKSGEDSGIVTKRNSAENGPGASWAGRYEKWEENSGRQLFEIKRDKRLMSEKFFTNHKMVFRKMY
jgi:hypothetical protein